MGKKRIVLLIIALVLLGVYYIWTFMLSLNSEVTSAFQIMNEKLIESNRAAETRLDSLKIKISNTEYSSKMVALDLVSTNLINHIDSLKQQLTSKISDPMNYSEMDNSSAADKLFFNEIGYSKKGTEFVKRINDYQMKLSELFQNDFPEITARIDHKFNKREDIDDWLEYNFKGFPLVATLTKLTQMQADINQIEKEILQSILAINN